MFPRRSVFGSLLALALAPALSAADAPPLVCMTYNLRYASEHPPHAWPTRRPLVRDVIRQANPDLLGTQEGVYPQLVDLENDLPGYRWIGLGREGGSRGEFMAVFYRTERLEPVAFDHFWLSDTPETMRSATWGNRIYRMVTWVRFRDRTNGREFLAWNTHFDHEHEGARQRSAALIRERVAALDPQVPLVLLGDFNAAAESSPVHAALTHDRFFQDTWQLAREREGEGLGTFNNFGEFPEGGERIDWILVRGRFDVRQARILAVVPGGAYPSDHYPVVAVLAWPDVAAPAPIGL